MNEPSKKINTDDIYIYESPDKGKTVYRRKFQESVRELITFNMEET